MPKKKITLKGRPEIILSLVCALFVGVLLASILFFAKKSQLASYTNTTYGYTFSYPKHWEVLPTEDHESELRTHVSLDRPDIFISVSPLNYLGLRPTATIEDRKNQLFAYVNDHPHSIEILAAENTRVANLPALKTIARHKDDSVDLNFTSVSYEFIHGPNIFSVSTHVEEGKYSQFDALVRSLKLPKNPPTLFGQ